MFSQKANSEFLNNLYFDKKIIKDKETKLFLFAGKIKKFHDSFFVKISCDWLVFVF